MRRFEVCFLRPFGALQDWVHHPRLTPWASLLRRFAAGERRPRLSLDDGRLSLANVLISYGKRFAPMVGNRVRVAGFAVVVAVLAVGARGQGVASLRSGGTAEAAVPTQAAANGAQTGDAQKPANGTQAQTGEVQKQTGGAQAPTGDAQKQKGDAQAQTGVPPQGAEKKISPKEAEELFRSVDEILAALSKETGYPIKHEVKRRLTSRDEVAAYITKHMSEDEDAQRLRRSEAVLKKFGLLPRDFDMETFLVAMLREQVAGYYDPKTKTVNLLDWVDAEQQRPVMAHELTHALQDQSFDLEKWMRAGEVDLAAKKQPSPADIANDETIAARQAVVEGQATVTLLDYLLTPTGQSVTTAPQLVEAMKAGMVAGTPDSYEFRKAPIYLRQAMLFGYLYGLDFTIALLKAGGKQKAFEGAFLNPPQSTRQIMQPETYLAGEKIDPVPLPDFDRDFKNYERFDIGAIGEFDVAVMIEQYAGEEVSKKLYPHWRGGYYYAVRPKGKESAPLGLLYVSRWSDAATAGEFADVYAKALGVRYKKLEAVEKGGAEGVAMTWVTDEGNVVITRRANTVVVSESLDNETTKRVEKVVLGK